VGVREPSFAIENALFNIASHILEAETKVGVGSIEVVGSEGRTDKHSGVHDEWGLPYGEVLNM